MFIHQANVNAFIFNYCFHKKVFKIHEELPWTYGAIHSLKTCLKVSKKKTPTNEEVTS